MDENDDAQIEDLDDAEFDKLIESLEDSIAVAEKKIGKVFLDLHEKIKLLRKSDNPNDRLRIFEDSLSDNEFTLEDLRRLFEVLEADRTKPQNEERK